MKECRGCTISLGYCVFKETKLEDECPCQECLVKVTCNKEDCQERTDVAAQRKIVSTILGNIKRI